MATAPTTTKKPAAAKKTTAPKTASTKITATKKPVAKKAPAKKPATASPFERYKMVEVAAYYIAEKDGFQGFSVDYWIAAEKEIDKKLSKK